MGSELLCADCFGTLHARGVDRTCACQMRLQYSNSTEYILVILRVRLCINSCRFYWLSEVCMTVSHQEIHEDYLQYCFAGSSCSVHLITEDACGGEWT